MGAGDLNFLSENPTQGQPQPRVQLYIGLWVGGAPDHLALLPDRPYELAWITPIIAVGRILAGSLSAFITVIIHLSPTL